MIATIHPLLAAAATAHAASAAVPATAAAGAASAKCGTTHPAPTAASCCPAANGSRPASSAPVPTAIDAPASVPDQLGQDLSAVCEPVLLLPDPVAAIHAADFPVAGSALPEVAAAARFPDPDGTAAAAAVPAAALPAPAAAAVSRHAPGGAHLRAGISILMHNNR